ncbi:P-loop containing nucleoside triphosphate hydrolase protein [Dendrothele bispora CBS 962.96]|uniref:DNA 3'-5' helicase n=1 Tax=Dendrothele bispora (strain CBS 962.96) TaxID=1314807 RepID=A0A4S8MJK5_DENBC|nr:P-loop containing nucleoside triphosphate hydrolase protein [Dendrothele bispora CBS 962.96]
MNPFRSYQSNSYTSFFASLGTSYSNPYISQCPASPLPSTLTSAIFSSSNSEDCSTTTSAHTQLPDPNASYLVLNTEKKPVYTCRSYLQYIKTLTLAQLHTLAREEIPMNLLPWAFIEDLNSEFKKMYCYQLCLVCWNATNKTQCPKLLQLEFACAILMRRDIFLEAGTGFGKTLASVFRNCCNDGITIIISPLKRLQLSQAESIFRKYGLCTIVVNEDTDDSNEFWRASNSRAGRFFEPIFQCLTCHQMNVYDFSKKGGPGCGDIFIVTPEQFFRNPQGHDSSFGKIVRKHPFRRQIRLTVVDEAQFIHTYGLPHYGMKAFRDAYGQLNDIKVLFGLAIPWAAMTATATYHILKTIEKRVLRPSYLHLRTTSNRPNIMYASHCVPGQIDQLENYKCFLSSPFDFKTQKRVLIFRDNMNPAVAIADYLDSLLPPEYRDRGIVQHYHSMMSKGYQSDTHREFTESSGNCKIMVATAGESTGIDHPDVEIVCLAGLPSDITDLNQRGGRAVRLISGHGLCVLFHEKWALDLDLAEYGMDSTNKITLDSIDFHSNIDRPRKSSLTPNSCPQDRASLACVLFTRRKFCARAFFAKCLRDDSPEALEYSTPFCCDAHENGFDLESFLPSKLYTPLSTMDTDTDTIKTQKTKRCSTATQDALTKRLESWRINMHNGDMYAAVRPIYYILPDSHIKLLVAQLPHSIRSGYNVTYLLEQTYEWGKLWADKIYRVIARFDQEEERSRSAEFIDESDCDEEKWTEVLERDRITRERTEEAALNAIGEEVETKKRGRKNRVHNFLVDLTNTK